MRIALLFPRVVTKPEYAEVERRRLETYLRFKPEIPHELIVVNRYADPPIGVSDPQWDYHGIASRFIRYDGGGWDCGCWKHVGGSLDHDLVVGCNSSVYFTRPGWLERLVDETQRNGVGLYGPLASNFYLPHLRTPCLAFQPEVIRKFTAPIETRQNTYQFECLGYPDCPNFTLWCRNQGYRTLLVTWDGCWDLPDWRNPDNVFHKGDQSNCLVQDRHCDLYRNETPEKQIEIQRSEGDHV